MSWLQFFSLFFSSLFSRRVTFLSLSFSFLTLSSLSLSLSRPFFFFRRLSNHRRTNFASAHVHREIPSITSGCFLKLAGFINDFSSAANRRQTNDPISLSPAILTTQPCEGRFVRGRINVNVSRTFNRNPDKIC